MDSLARIARLIDLFSEWTGRLIAWLTLGMVLVTFAVVLLRYLFNTGWIAMQESYSYMYALVFMLGAAYTLRHDGHVRVDIFYQKFGPRGRAWVDLLGTLLLLAPVTIFIAWESWWYVAPSWAQHEGSSQPGGLPWVYLLKTAIPVMAVQMLLQGTSLAIRSLLVILGHEKEGPAHDSSTEV